MSMSDLPEGIVPEDEISIIWDQSEDGITKVVAELGGARVIVMTDEASIHLVPWLVASAPQILDAAWAEIEHQNTEQQEEAP